MTSTRPSLLRPGLCSVTFRTLAVDDVARRAHAAGLRAVEWGTDVHVPLDDVAAQDRVRALSAGGGPAVASLGTYYRADSPAPFDDPLSLLLAAKRAGAPRIRVWAGSVASAEATGAQRDLVARRLRDLADAAADILPGAVIGVELHSGTLADTESAALDLLDAVRRDNIGSYWQPGIAVSNEAALAGLRLLANRVVAVHVFSWWPALERLPLLGRVELWREVVAVLHGLSRPLDLLLEFVPDDDPTVLQREADSLRQLIEEAA